MRPLKDFKNFSLGDDSFFEPSSERIPRPILDLIRDVWLLNRVSNSDDMLEAQERVAQFYKTFLRGTPTVHLINAGAEYNHWIVPKRWRVKDYWIKDDKGRVVDDLNSHPLALCPFSHSTNEVITLEELRGKAIVHPDQPDAYTYFGHRMYRHWVGGWNVSLPRRKLDALLPGQYEVHIESEFTDDPMPVLEYMLAGRSERTIVLIGHICHPGQVNDSLSGCVALIQALQRLEEVFSETLYTYRILLVPEVVGSVAYLGENPDLVADMAFAMCANMSSHDAPLVVGRSKLANSLLDIALELAVRSSGEAHVVAPFGRHPDCGDEICFDCVGVNIPTVTLSRNGEFFETYHSSSDTLENFSSPDNQRRHQIFSDVIFHALRMMEENFSMTANFRGLPCLSNPDVDLYLSPSNINNSVFSDGLIKDDFGKDVDTRYFMEFFLDALNRPGISPLEIAYAANLPFGPVHRYATAFAERRLIEKHSMVRTEAILDVSNLPLIR